MLNKEHHSIHIYNLDNGTWQLLDTPEAELSGWSASFSGSHIFWSRHEENYVYIDDEWVEDNLLKVHIYDVNQPEAMWQNYIIETDAEFQPGQGGRYHSKMGSKLFVFPRYEGNSVLLVDLEDGSSQSYEVLPTGYNFSHQPEIILEENSLSYTSQSWNGVFVLSYDTMADEWDFRSIFEGSHSPQVNQFLVDGDEVIFSNSMGIHFKRFGQPEIVSSSGSMMYSLGMDHAVSVFIPGRKELFLWGTHEWTGTGYIVHPRGSLLDLNFSETWVTTETQD